MATSNIITTRDGTERARLRRCIEAIGPARVAGFFGQARGTVTAYAAGAPIQYANEMLIVLRLPELEAEVEALRKRTA